MKRISLMFALLLVMSACGVGETTRTTTESFTAGGVGPVGLFASSLSQFDQCDDLRDYYVDAALEQVGPYGLGGGYGYYTTDVAFAEDGARLSDDGATSAPQTSPANQSEGVAGVDFSTTNVQEEGVDEPDSVKTDGDYIYSLLRGMLQVVDVRDGSPKEIGTLEFENMSPFGMLLSGDRLLISGSSWGDGRYYSEVYQLMVVDVSDPADPTIIQTMEVDGTGVSSRLIDGTVHIVLRSRPVGFNWVQPEGSGLRAEGAAEDANIEIIKNSTWENWLPYYILEDHRTGDTSKGTLLDCSNVYAPPAYSGLATLSVLSVDLGDGGLGTVAASGVVAEGEVVYASSDNLYVATQRWMDFGRITSGEDEFDNEFRTQIHKFEFRDTVAQYVASGDVTGFINGQWAMSEHEGDLRVVSTNSFGGWWSGDSVSQVTVLRPTAGELKEIGQVGGLGKTEQVQSVRFIGDMGYVVTFRQTDPLYVIDLSEPTNPTVAGELKILGYSAYLHPLGDGLLLGIGQDATESGRVTGTQVSLFDVSDPANPSKIDGITVDDAHSQAEWDHHAFLYWNPSDLMLAPFSSWSWDEDNEKETFDTGVLAVKRDGDSLSLEATLRNGLKGPYTWDRSNEGDDTEYINPWQSTVQRTVIVNGIIYTLGHGGIGVHELDTLETVEYVQWDGVNNG